MGDGAPFCDQMRFNDNLGHHGLYGVHSSEGVGTAALNLYFPDGYEFLHNALITEGNFVGSYPATTIFKADNAACNFVDYNGGNYRIASGELKNGATDGTDIGCDIDALEAAIAGVVL